MFSLRKPGAWFAIALTLSVPALACLDRTDLTLAEQECCTKMADQCDATAMPASHSCCTPVARDSNSAVLVRTSGLQHAPAWTAELLVVHFSSTLTSRSLSALVPPRSESPPPSITILRI
jgi:hypothetical protein